MTFGFSMEYLVFTSVNDHCPRLWIVFYFCMVISLTSSNSSANSAGLVIARVLCSVLSLALSKAPRI